MFSRVIGIKLTGGEFQIEIINSIHSHSSTLVIVEIVYNYKYIYIYIIIIYY